MLEPLYLEAATQASTYAHDPLPDKSAERLNGANDGDSCKVSQPLILVCAFSMPEWVWVGTVAAPNNSPKRVNILRDNYSYYQLVGV